MFAAPMRATPVVALPENNFEVVGAGSATGNVANILVSRFMVTFDGINLSRTGSVGMPFAYLGRVFATAEL